jgi:hypothetical protein
LRVFHTAEYSGSPRLHHIFVLAAIPLFASSKIHRESQLTVSMTTKLFCAFPVVPVIVSPYEPGGVLSAGGGGGAALPPPQPENEAASTIKQSSKLAFQRILDGKSAAMSIENAKAHARSLLRVCSDADEATVVVTITLNGEGVVLILIPADFRECAWSKVRELFCREILVRRMK